jgi:hypothetical protein
VIPSCKFLMSMGIGFTLVAGVISAAEAKVVAYEINGQRYTYSTNNREQTRIAKQRIEAAKVVSEARTRALAEVTANPLVTILGSPVQREAQEAEARLHAVFQGAPNSAENRRPATPSTIPEPPRRPSEAELDATPIRPTISSTGTVAVGSGGTSQIEKTPPGRTANRLRPSIKSVSFDLETGIRTVFMSDGTIHEDPLDSRTRAGLETALPSEAELRKSVDQVRTAADGTPSSEWD